VNQFFTRMSEEVLLEEPGMQPLRKRLLEDALRYYQGFLQQRGDDPALRVELALAYYRAGLITKEIGSKTAALEALQTARALLEQLAAANPSDTRLQHQLPLGRYHVALLESNLGKQPADVLQSFQEALTLFEQLAAANSAEMQVQRDRAACYHSIGLLERDQRVLAESRRLREQLVRDNPGVAELQYELAVSHNDIGSMQVEARQTEAALASFTKAIELLVRLDEEYPTITKYKDTRASIYNNLGNFQSDTGQPEAALASYDKARAIYEQLAQANPAVARFSYGLAQTLNYIGALYGNTRRFKEALDFFLKARDVWKKLADANPQDIELQQRLAHVYSNIGATGQSGDDRAAFMESLRIRERLAQNYPNDHLIQNDLATSYYHLGQMHLVSKQPAQALPYYEQSREVLVRLVEAEPRAPRFRSRLGKTLNNIGYVQWQLGRLEEALTAYEQAVTHQRLAFDWAPKVEEHRFLLAKHYDNVANCQRALGRHQPSAAAAQERLRLYPDDADVLYGAACQLAQCVPLVGKDKAELTAAEQDQRRRYADRARDALRQALDKGFKDAERLQKDPDLDPLRSRADFKELLDRLVEARSGTNHR
jgi:tetratricopeptide (TPR) repeat protein